jgi:hypothetical protein
MGWGDIPAQTEAPDFARLSPRHDPTAAPTAVSVTREHFLAAQIPTRFNLSQVGSGHASDAREIFA